MIDRQTCMCALKCFGNVAADYLPDVLEPLGAHGKALSALIKMVQEGVSAFKNEQEALQKQSTQDQPSFEELKEQAYEELRQAFGQSEIPKFMDCVVFTCKYGVTLSEEQQEILKAVLLQEYESTDSRSLLIIDEFLKEYMGEAIEVDSIDDCDISDTYISFNFFSEVPYGEHPYEKEDMDLVMEALNNFLGTEVFDYYLVDGHDESWLDE